LPIEYRGTTVNNNTSTTTKFEHKSTKQRGKTLIHYCETKMRGDPSKESCNLHSKTKNMTQRTPSGQTLGLLYIYLKKNPHTRKAPSPKRTII